MQWDCFCSGSLDELEMTKHTPPLPGEGSSASADGGWGYFPKLTLKPTPMGTLRRLASILNGCLCTLVELPQGLILCFFLIMEKEVGGWNRRRKVESKNLVILNSFQDLFWDSA